MIDALRKAAGMWLYGIAIMLLPSNCRECHFALIAFGEAKKNEIQAQGGDVEEEAKKLLAAWRDERA